MKYLEQYLEQKLHIKALGEITTQVEESTFGAYVGEEIIIDGNHTNIIVYYIDYIDWLENEFLEKLNQLSKVTILQ